MTKISWNQFLTKNAKDFSSSSHRFDEFFPSFSGGSANISDDSSSNTSPLSALLCRNNTSPTGNSNNGGSNSFQNESSVDVGHGNFKRSASADTLGAFNSGGPSSSFISSSNMKGKIEWIMSEFELQMGIYYSVPNSIIFSLQVLDPGNLLLKKFLARLLTVIMTMTRLQWP